MLDGLAYIRQRQLQGEHVLVLGDSELVINFLTRAYKPKLRDLVVRVQTAHEWQREWRRAGGPHLEFRHVPREFNTWADWLARVARYMRRDVRLDEFAEIWPSDMPAPKEIGASVWKSRPLGTHGISGPLGEALGELDCELRRPALEAWVGAKSRGLRIESIRCPKCDVIHIDNGACLKKAHLWHVCQRCGEKFKGNCAAVGTPLPPNPLLTTEVLE